MRQTGSKVRSARILNDPLSTLVAEPTTRRWGHFSSQRPHDSVQHPRQTPADVPGRAHTNRRLQAIPPDRKSQSGAILDNGPATRHHQIPATRDRATFISAASRNRRSGSSSSTRQKSIGSRRGDSLDAAVPAACQRHRQAGRGEHAIATANSMRTTRWLRRCAGSERTRLQELAATCHRARIDKTRTETHPAPRSRLTCRRKSIRPARFHKLLLFACQSPADGHIDAYRTYGKCHERSRIPNHRRIGQYFRRACARRARTTA